MLRIRLLKLLLILTSVICLAWILKPLQNNSVCEDIENLARRRLHSARNRNKELHSARKRNIEVHSVRNRIKELYSARNRNIEVHSVRNRIKELRSARNRNKELRSTSNQNDGNEEQRHRSFYPEREYLLRRSKNNLEELWYAVEAELKKAVKRNQGKRNQGKGNLYSTLQIHSGIFKLSMQFQAAKIDLDDIFALSGDWKSEEAKGLQELVQTRLHYLQNPKNCDNARQLICRMDVGCGFGCEIHHLSYCLMVAYQLQRTLILEGVFWYYEDRWSDVFEPISQTCPKSNVQHVKWKGEEKSKDVQAVYFPVKPGMVEFPPKTGIPADLYPRLLRLHGNPYAWWNGQILKYLMRPQPEIHDLIEDFKEKNRIHQPLVGVHVRRTDKVGTEAAFHGIEEYMKHVIAWYDKLDMKLAKEKSSTKSVRRVYLASDEPTVIDEAHKKYPDYVFLSYDGGEGVPAVQRYMKNNLEGVLVNIFILAQCNFIVCTFSSGFCRVAYELMQTFYPDASDYFHSLDDSYYYIGQTSREEIVVYPHKGNGFEVDLEVDDVIGVLGNHWDGFSQGTVSKSGKVGVYPSYKTRTIFEQVQCPTYEEAIPVNYTIR